MKKRTKKEITAILKKRKLEDLDIIELVEKYLKKRRKQVISLKGEKKAILLVSGGMDSIATWAYLMHELKIKVYPVFLRRGQRRVSHEEKAVDFFESYFKKRYPKYFYPVKKMDAFIPPMEIRFPITIASNNPIGKKGQWRSIPVYSSLLFSYAVQYGYFLELTENIRVRTIFASFMRIDGHAMKEETLTAMRAVNLMVSALTDDYDWQVIALPLEKELGFFHNKEDFIQWADSINLPLEKTRSCVMWARFPFFDDRNCGECFACFNRREAFELAKIDDKTTYYLDIWNSRKKSIVDSYVKTKKLLKKILKPDA